MKLSSLLAITTAYEIFEDGGARIPGDLQSCIFTDAERGDGGNRIVGGTDARESSWPWIVQLGRTFENGTDFDFCGGTVVHDRFVLTAEHCLDGIESLDPNDTTEALQGFYLTFGEWKRTEGNKYKSNILKAHFRPDRYKYNGELNKFSADLALLEFPSLQENAPSQFDDKIGIACLPKTEYVPGANCWIGGWGWTSLSSPVMTNVLKETNISLMSPEYCRDKSFLDVIESKSEYVAETHEESTVYYWKEFCAGAIDKDGDNWLDGGRDTCRGDSGGPLICNVNGRATLTGVTSWGPGCGAPGGPGVYSDVHKYYDWIIEILESGKSTETTQPPPITTQKPAAVSVDLIMTDLKRMTEIKCVKADGTLKELQTNNKKRRQNKLLNSVMQVLQMNIFNTIHCSNNLISDLSISEFFNWETDLRSFPEFLSKLVEMAEFRHSGCKSRKRSNSKRRVREKFRKYMDFIKIIKDNQNCFGERMKVVLEHLFHP